MIARTSTVNQQTCNGMTTAIAESEGWRGVKDEEAALHSERRRGRLGAWPCALTSTTTERTITTR
jgi:hypothetical protein